MCTSCTSTSTTPPSSYPIPFYKQNPFYTLLNFTSCHPHQKVPSCIFTRASINFTRPHHSVSPEHQSVHQTPSVSFTREYSDLREVFTLLIITNLLSYIFHIINKKYFILLYIYLWNIILCLQLIIVTLSFNF